MGTNPNGKSRLETSKPNNAVNSQNMNNKSEGKPRIKFFTETFAGAAARGALPVATALLFFGRTVLAQTPPAITSQPADVLAGAGGAATLSVGVSGTGPFSYQWYFNGAPASINGTITTVAGGGAGDGDAATKAPLNGPYGLAVDGAGNFFIVESGDSRIRKVGTNGIITTVAGKGAAGYSGDGAAATNATLNNPAGAAVDGAGNLFIADTRNNRIRRVDTNGIITTVAGEGAAGYSGDGGAATSASLKAPNDVTADAAGNLFIADTGNNRIRKVGTNGIITTVASPVSLSFPAGLTVDGAGNLFIADNGNNRIRRVDTNGIITTVAGNGTQGYSGDGRTATNASLDSPSRLAMDGAGNLFIADNGNNRIRRVDTNGIITTVAGKGAAGYSGDGAAATNATLYYPYGVAVDAAGNLLIADTSNSRIRKVDINGIITTVAGNGTSGYWGDGGPATSASLNAIGIAVDAAANLFISDALGDRIRKVGTNGIISTAAGNGTQGYSGDGGPATNASLYFPCNAALDVAGNFFIADYYNNCIRKVGTNGIISTAAGKGAAGYSGDGAAATNAKLNNPAGAAVDAAGNLFIADQSNNRIRKVDTNGIITTVAGEGAAGYSGDGGAATTASLNAPNDVAVDAAGNLFIADFANFRIRKVGTNGIITTVAGRGTRAYSGDGGAATSASLSGVEGVKVDAAGNLFIADTGNNRIRKVGTNGIISTVAGNGTQSYSGDDGPATNASFNFPSSLALDAVGNLFIADSENYRVRKITASNASLANEGASLVLSNLTAANAGDYYVLVTGADGSVTSSVARLSLTAAQPQFTGIMLTNGSVSMICSGTASSNYVVLSATNLTPPITWIPLVTNTADASGNIMVVDTNIIGISSKFYRVSSP
jgi:sugar lactone lactonase YvrE